MSLRVTLEPDSPKPLVRQIQDALRQQIASGQLAPGQRLPSMQQMVNDMG